MKPPKIVVINAAWCHFTYERQEYPLNTSFVYFAAAADAGLVKIGHSVSPVSRVNELRTGCPYPLSLQGTMIGGPEQERAVHAIFAKQKFRSEWFRMSSDIQEFIGLLKESGHVAWLKMRQLILNIN